MTSLGRIPWMGQVDTVLASVFDMFYSRSLMWLLIGTGIFLTTRTRGVQVRHIDVTTTSVIDSRDGNHGGTTSFQAFAAGLTCRVGTGNIVGVTLTLIPGGPGAVLQMWLVATLDAATVLSETTLAQLFKMRHSDDAFRGSPACCISRGLELPILSGVFAVVFLIANGLVMPMMQANAITASPQRAGGPSPSLGAVLVVALTAPVLLGDLRVMTRVTEYLVPLMALAYLMPVLAAFPTHLVQAFEVVHSIIEGALGLCQGLGGLAGGVTAALLNDVYHGLFSNGTGLGGAACAVGSVTVSHPVQQGFIQVFEVVVDTLFVCTTTALAVPVAGVDILQSGASAKESAETLTRDAIAHLVGGWSHWPMVLLAVILVYITIIRAFSYAQVYLNHLTDRPWVTRALQIGAVICAGIGSMQQLTTVQTLADVLLGLDAIIDLVALVFLSRWIIGVPRDREARRSTSITEGDRSALRKDSEYLPAPLPGSA